jgi:hypothetical protein
MLDIGEKVAYEGEAITTEDLDIHDIDSALIALRVYRAAYIQHRSSAAVLATTGKKLAQLLGEGGAAAIGGNIVRFKKPYKENVIDAEKLAAYMQQQLVSGGRLISEMFNVAYTKRGWMDKAVRDTFFEKDEGEEPTLSMTPRDKAPKFLQFLEDGEVFTKTRPEE